MESTISKWSIKKGPDNQHQAGQNTRTYVTALHEIGHIVGRGRSGTRLQQEAAAWQYVLDTSVVALAPGTYRSMLRFLTTYLKASERAARRKTGRYILPTENDPFWVTYRFIKERAGT